MGSAQKTLTISQARRDLSALVKQVASTGDAVYIGPRGKVIAVLVGVAEYEKLRRRARTRPAGWDALRLEVKGPEGGFEEAFRELRRDINQSIERRLARVKAVRLAPARARKRRR